MGEMELMSTTVVPGRNPSATPPGPKSTASTSGVSGTIVMTTSERAATSFPPEQATPPLASRSAGTGFRSWRKSLCPAPARLAAMGRPMIPSPTNPTSMDAPPSGAREVRREPAEAGGGLPARLVLASDPAAVVHRVELLEDERVVDLAGARLVAPGIVGHLDVGDAGEVPAQRLHEVSLHDLH